jgi:hydroxymethylbilane synthase
MILSAFPEREEPRDAMIGTTLEGLAEGATVGTSSLRRAAQLRALGRGLEIETLRGNVDTRLRKLDEGRYDAIVLAAAGLRRLGWQERICELIPVEVMCPAVGQGALAIETRADDGPGERIARELNHEPTRIAVEAERAMLAVLGGGCQVPIGAHATVHGAAIHLRGVVLSPDGSQVVKGEFMGSDPHVVGLALGRQLLGSGAQSILSAL